MKALSKLGVDAQNAFECGKMLFEEEDAVSFTDFMRVVLTLRGSNKTTVKDMVELRRFIGEEQLGAFMIIVGANVKPQGDA